MASNVKQDARSLRSTGLFGAIACNDSRGKLKDVLTSLGNSKGATVSVVSYWHESEVTMLVFIFCIAASVWNI